MATAGKNLSQYDKKSIPNGKEMVIGIVVSEWNDHITNNLLNGAVEALIDNGVKRKNIIIRFVPGAFELPLGAQLMLENTDVEGVICLGSVIQGETRHFDFVCQGATDGIMKVGLDFSTPVILGLLTDNTEQQAKDRSGGKHGNKGTECAIACMKMIEMGNSFDY
jgi:6,7-dimethyl-8-ribityllumazine synthase